MKEQLLNTSKAFWSAMERADETGTRVWEQYHQKYKLKIIKNANQITSKMIDRSD